MIRPAAQQVGSLARRRPLAAAGFTILLIWSIVVIAAIGGGAGWLGIGRYDPDTVFRVLNPQFVHLKLAPALDGAPADASPGELRNLLSDPDLSGPFAADLDLQSVIRDYVDDLIDDDALIARLVDTADPVIELSGGRIRDITGSQFSTDANHPRIANSLAGPSADHWFGTNRGGRDTWSRFVDGAWRSLYIGLLAPLIGLAAGAVCALATAPLNRTRAGRFLSDAGLAALDGLRLLTPLLLTGLILIAGKWQPIWFALAFASIAAPTAWRIIRTSTDVEPDADQVPTWQEQLRTAAPRLAALFTAAAIASILTDAAFAFVFLPASESSWAALIAEGSGHIITSPWLSLIPGLALSSLLFAVAACGHALRRSLQQPPAAAQSQPETIIAAHHVSTL